ncbi:MAG: hypothetical protein PHY14_04030 [Candidatus Gracilibacteria bacterium]|nr:hypothetical protein [Candidatus Gracilibacteria bacterium]
MFSIPVGDLLASYSGDSKSFSFSGEVYDGYYDDISFLAPLNFQIRIVAVDSGVEVIFDNLTTEVIYENRKHIIQISGFERTFKTRIDPLEDADDVRQIENGGQTIDLGPIIREEIIMACHSF